MASRKQCFLMSEALWVQEGRLAHSLVVSALEIAVRSFLWCVWPLKTKCFVKPGPYTCKTIASTLLWDSPPLPTRTPKPFSVQRGPLRWLYLELNREWATAASTILYVLSKRTPEALRNRQSDMLACGPGRRALQRKVHPI